MLDLTSITFTSAMMLLVIFRAFKLDREQPWFQTVKFQAKATGASAKPWQRR